MIKPVMFMLTMFKPMTLILTMFKPVTFMLTMFNQMRYNLIRLPIVGEVQSQNFSQFQDWSEFLERRLKGQVEN